MFNMPLSKHFVMGESWRNTSPEHTGLCLGEESILATFEKRNLSFFVSVNVQAGSDIYLLNLLFCQLLQGASSKRYMENLFWWWIAVLALTCLGEGVQCGSIVQLCPPLKAECLNKAVALEWCLCLVYASSVSQMKTDVCFRSRIVHLAKSNLHLVCCSIPFTFPDLL